MYIFQNSMHLDPSGNKYPQDVLTLNIHLTYIRYMMTLHSYLTGAKISQADFAALVGVKQPTVNRWVNGARPSWEAAAKIEQATSGKVPVGVWVSQNHSPSTAASSEPATADGSALPPKNVGTVTGDCKGAA